ncbi:MAG: hypothetical protein M3443_19555 [Actinomycetota bacterium]|nr:hypothetical protein [Actinomycetota bacterium]
MNPAVAHALETEDGTPRVITTDTGPVRVAVCRAWLSEQDVDIMSETVGTCSLCRDLKAVKR